MKIKKIMFGMVGTVIALGAVSLAVIPNTNEVKAGLAADGTSATLDQGEVLLRIVHEGETTDEEILASLNVYHWNDGGDVAWPGEPISELGLKQYDETHYTFTLPMVEEASGESYLHDKFILNIAGKGQTADSAWMGLDATHEYLLTINAEGSVVGGGWNKIVQTYTNEMLRLWVDRGLATNEQGYLMLHYWKDGVDSKTIPTGYAEITVGKWLAYYDVPKADLVGSHVQFIRNNADGTYAATFNANEVGEENVYVTGDNAEIYYLWDDGATFGRGSLAPAEKTVPVANLKLVLEGYFSCSSDADNGYGKFNQVMATWIKYTGEDGAEHWRTDGELSSVMLDDFSDEASYVTGNRQTESIDAWSKVLMMEGLYNAANTQSGLYGVINPTMDNTMIIVIVSILFVLTSGTIAFIAFKFKKSNRVNK